jgi:hypothetical protein
MIVSVAAHVEHRWLRGTGGMHTSNCILDGPLLLAFDTEQSWAIFRKVLPSRIYDYGARLVGNIGMTRASLLTCYCLLEGLRQVCLIIV